jgi:hypothetical protein
LFKLFVKYYEQILIKAAGTVFPDIYKDVPQAKTFIFSSYETEI